jgi:hypothetical protein
MVLLRNRRDFWLVTVLGVLVGGAGIWLVGKPGVLGVSDHSPSCYLPLAGWFDRRFGSVALLLWPSASGVGCSRHVAFPERHFLKHTSSIPGRGGGGYIGRS